MNALLSILATLLPTMRFEGLTIGQWVTIASAIGTAEPEIKSAIAALHPAFTAIASDLATGKSADEAGSAAHVRNIPSEMSGTR
jgi:hypothetical protein